MSRVIIFIALSAVPVYVSRASLRHPGSHGFYRFFAWELIIVLFLLNFENFGQWFRDPFSLHQLASWTLLFGSLVPLILGVRLLRAVGKPDRERREDASLLGIEQTTHLVTTGIFKYIRHPLYSSLLLLTWGVFLKNVSLVGSAVSLGATVFLLLTAKVEERENAGYFGPAYRAYIKKTKMFIPFLF